ncbi:MAG: lamin tail domain-containing protein [Candidatus Nanohaloarchaea archaeon]
MASMYEAATMASLIVGLVSIPAASQSIDVPGNVSENMPDVSEISNMPRNTVTRTTPESARKVVETAFSRYREEISQGRTEVVLKGPRAKMKIETTPTGKRTVLTTPGGKLILRQTPEKTVQKVKTPRGTLKTTREDGGVKVEFEGSDREAVEQAARELRKILEKKRKKASEHNIRMRKRMRPELGLTVHPDSEKVVITNSGQRRVDLEGWKLTDSSGSTFVFPKFVLGTGEEVTVYTESGEDNSTALHWGTSSVWNNGEDTATLFNEKGEEIATKSY